MREADSRFCSAIACWSWTCPPSTCSNTVLVSVTDCDVHLLQVDLWRLGRVEAGLLRCCDDAQLAVERFYKYHLTA